MVDSFGRTLLGLVILYSGVGEVVAQGRQTARRNPSVDVRLQTTRAEIDSLELSTGALRAVLLDTMLGTPSWIIFAPEEVAREGRIGVLDGVLQQFIARHRRLFGLDAPQAELREIRRDRDGDLTHIRFQQYWHDVPVESGVLIVHVRRYGSRFVVEAANGMVFPDISVPAAPALGPEVAAGIARSHLATAQGLMPEVVQQTLVVRLMSDRYIHAHRVSTSENTVIVDAATGLVVGEDRRGRGAGPSGPEPAGHVDASSRRESDPGAVGRPPVDQEEAAGAAVEYVDASGTDALNVFHGNGFKVYINGSHYEMRSNALGSVLSELVVRDYGGLNYDALCRDQPIAISLSTSWPEDTASRQHVSAMVNGMATGSYFWNTYGRASWDADGAALTVCVNGRAFDGGIPIFSGRSSPVDNTIRFVQDSSGTWLGSAATRDMVTHEFTHNITRHDSAASADDDYETIAVDEALADYFGARHRGNPCMGAFET